MLVSYWLTPAEILVDRSNQSGFYHGELRLLTMLERNDDDPHCDKLDKLFYFYVTDAEDPILLVYSTIMATAYIKQGYNRFYAHVIRNRPYWLKAWLVSDRLLDYSISSDVKIYHQQAVEIFDTATARNLLTAEKLKHAKSTVDIGSLIKTRREDFSFKVETQRVLATVRPGVLKFGSRQLTLNGRSSGSTVTVDVKDHASVSEAVAVLFQQCGSPQ